jgi:UDP-N-acetylmuramate-alanine ligase
MSFEKVIYTEAIPNTQEELQQAKQLNIFTQTYPEALAEIVNKKRLIAVA